MLIIKKILMPSLEAWRNLWLGKWRAYFHTLYVYVCLINAPFPMKVLATVFFGLHLPVNHKYLQHLKNNFYVADHTYSVFRFPQRIVVIIVIGAWLANVWLQSNARERGDYAVRVCDNCSQLECNCSSFRETISSLDWQRVVAGAASSSGGVISARSRLR